MANSKISALTSASTPLAGTETLPIVQSGATVKVQINDLTVRNIRAVATTGILQVSGPTAGTTRTATVPDANWTAARTDAAQSFTGNQTLSTGNLVVSNGKGIDFSATPGTGTSELFADYEEGTWTPADGSGAGLAILGNACYTKVGRMVYWQLNLNYPITSSSALASISGIPFALVNPSGAAGRAGSSINVTTVTTLTNSLQIETSNIIRFYKAGFVQATNAELSNSDIYCSGFYST